MSIILSLSTTTCDEMVIGLMMIDWEIKQGEEGALLFSTVRYKLTQISKLWWYNQRRSGADIL